MHVECSHGVGEACAVHVDFQVAALRNGGNRAHFFDAIDSAHFGGLRERHNLGLWVVDVGAAGDDGFDRIGCQLAGDARRGQQFRTVREELRAAALVGFDMGQLVADHRMVRLTQRREG
jgi:hypothetical protein